MYGLLAFVLLALSLEPASSSQQQKQLQQLKE